MDDQKAQKSTIGWPGIILISVMASNLLWLHSPLKSTRPKEESRFETLAMGDQTAEARLWQDPFEAVSLHRGKAGTEGLSNDGGTDLNGVADQIRRRSNHGTNLTLLPVMVTGTPYTEGGEWRVRTRYAILSGLDRAGYVTEDRSHVGFFEVGWPGAVELSATNEVTALTCGSSGAGLKLTVPFEWLEHYDSSSPDPDTSHRYVLVLWLEEEKFENAPLTRLALLIQGLRACAALGSNTPPIPVKIIGPYGSTTLRAMARNQLHERLVSAEDSPLAVSNILRGVTFYSATATAADWRIDPQTEDTNCHALHPTNEFRTRIRTALTQKAPGLSFTNVTCTDDQLAWALVGELMRRGVNLTNAESRVALISEWDTFYGRALPQSFTNALFHLGGGSPSNAVAVVWRFSYLRGLDGAPAGKGESSTERSTSARPDAIESSSMALAPLERPEGNSQLDYVPRLANTLKALEGESRRGQTDFSDRWRRAGHIEAIGLLGSDLYDKLLLLQSLRERFPEAIFFTTDLDARLAHVDPLKWSRNLIVASSFGLELSRQWQGSIAPFRDSYQTAQFLATLVATGVYTNDVASVLSPRLFEIGRTGPYDLSVVNHTASLHPPRLNEYVGCQPSGALAGPRAFLQRNIHLGLGLAAMVVLLLVLLSPKFRALIRWPYPNHNPGRMLRMLLVMAFVVLPGLNNIEWRLVGAGLVLAIWSVFGAAEGEERQWGAVGTAALATGAILCLFCRMMLHEHLSPEGEPISFVSGISIWPTELIRLVAAGLGIALLVKARGDLRKDTDSVVHDFALEVPKTFLGRDPSRFLSQPNGGTASGKGPFSQVFGSINRWLLRKLPAICIFGWDDKEVLAPVDGGPKQRVDGKLLWKRYNVLGKQSYRFLRVLLPAVTYLIAAVLLVGALGLPFCPYRGATSKALDVMALILSVAVFVVLTFYVMDATRLCTRFIDILSQWPTQWPLDTLIRFHGVRNLDAAALDEWIDVQFIAKRTKAVGRMIYYPFLVLFLMIIARNHFFDAWTLPVSLIVLLSVNAAYALFAAVHLRRRAERARRRSLSRLNEKLSRELGAIKDGRTNSNRAEQLRLLVREIESNTEGAFAPLSQQPLVGALLMPFGGAGVLALLEFLATTH